MTPESKNAFNPRSRPTTWSFGGGKGGVGKSFVCSSVAINLAQFGYSTLVIDLDLGSPNVHTCLGVPGQTKSLSDYLNGRVSNLEEVAVPTGIRNLSLISGFNDSLNAADVNTSLRDKLISDLQTLPYQFVLLDLSAGTHETTLDFFLASQRRIVVLTPEPTSIENAYRFIKSAFYRQVKMLEKDLFLRDIIEQAMDHKNTLGIRSPSDLIRYVRDKDPVRGQELYRRMSDFTVNLFVNQVRTRADVDLGESIRSVCRKYFGLSVELAGTLEHDNAVWQSLRKKRPLLLEYPHVPLYAQLKRATQVLLGAREYRASA